MRLCTLNLLGLGLLLAAGCKDDATDDSAPAQDADGDGVPSDEDCDDDNPAAYPGNAELCDGVDNDCNGYADDGAADATLWYVDYDGDGVGVQNVSFTQCEAPVGYVAALGDCDDQDPATYPGATELCDDSTDNNCEGLVDCDDSTCGGDAVCAPVITAIEPARGKTDESTVVTVSGLGFAWATAGEVSVTVGGQALTDVVVIDNDTLTATVPPGPEGFVDVVVSTDNGEATLSSGWRWFDFVLYAADGKQGAAGNLYEIDPAAGTVTTVGAIGYAVTGLATSPTGVLYATEATRFGNSRLLTIDPTTGAGTVVGELLDSTGTFTHGSCPDLEFVGDRLLGWSEYGDQLVEIDPATGVVTQTSSSIGTAGSGLGWDEDTGTLYLESYHSLYSIDPSTGAGTSVGYLSGQTYSTSNSMTYGEGQLWSTDANNGGGSTNLVTLDPATLTLTTVLALPDGVDALTHN